jgi:hypothetical protein
LALYLTAQPGLAADPAAVDEKPKTDPPSEKSAPPALTAATEKEGEVFKPPPGFKTKKRGDLVLYCQTDATVGTRFKTEKCYNEEQLRTYLMVTEAQRRDMDRIRTNCGGGPCTPFEPAMPVR